MSPAATLTRRRRATGRALTAAVVAVTLMLSTPSATGATDPAPQDRPDTLGAIDATAAALGGLRDLPTPSPITVRSLTQEIVALSRLLGVPLEPDHVAASVADARLAPQTQTTLAGLLARLSACTTLTQRLLTTKTLEQLATNPVPASSSGLGACATDLAADASAAVEILRDHAVGEEELRLWPVVAYAPDADADDVYREDFALLVDRGGNDRYLNNQGANMLDLKRSVSSEAARLRRPARGCEAVFPDASTGRLKRGPVGERVLSFDGPECSPAAALLIDLAGDDRYGRYARPGFPDDQCTPDRIVRRISTIGSGVAGVGMLIDESGDDVYLGKTGTQGAGHLGGVGLVDDRGGNDRYVAVRGAQGLGLLGGVGALRDRGGDDRYDFRMPRPLDPDAPNHTDGAGGVVDDTGLGSEAALGQQPDDGIGGTCDRLRRSLQGVGLLAGVGLLVDEAGADAYRAPLYLNQPFFTLQGATIHLAHGSQGSGYLGGAGVFIDLGGRDRYRRTNGKLSKTRADGVVRGPQVDPSTDEDAPANGKPVDISVFYDSGV
jgi:hypothetical protein